MSPEIIQRELRLPEGWRVVEEGQVLTHNSLPGVNKVHPVGEICTYTLLLWTAVIGLIVLESEGWLLALKIVLAVWLRLMHLVAYHQGRGAFFGNSLLIAKRLRRRVLVDASGLVDVPVVVNNCNRALRLDSRIAR